LTGSFVICYHDEPIAVVDNPGEDQYSTYVVLPQVTSDHVTLEVTRRVMTNAIDPDRPYVRAFLDLCTSHVSQATGEWITTQAAKGEDAITLMASTAYGWFVYASEERSEGIPDDLWQCMEFARECHCDYILFDRDAVAIDELPTYDW
jgi:hypothetical protein